MAENEINLVSCTHMQANPQGRSENGVLMRDGNVLNLCDDCYTVVQSTFMYDLVKQALMEVFDKQVASALTP